MIFLQIFDQIPGDRLSAHDVELNHENSDIMSDTWCVAAATVAVWAFKG